MARRRGGRGRLTEDDRRLWSQVARSVTPISSARRKAAEPPPAPVSDPPPIARDHALAPLTPITLPPGFRVGALPAPPVAPAPSAPQPLRMDARTHRDLTRGKMRPEARIDLHGLTLAAAKAELTGFILSAQASGRRLVLVITGKGRGGGDHGPLPTRPGALRHEVPHWLQMAPMAGAVQQVLPAHIRHGGGGAYYVWLRRFRG